MISVEKCIPIQECYIIFILLTLFLSPPNCRSVVQKYLGFSLVGHSPKHHIIFFHINNRSYLAPFPPIVDSSVRYHNVLESSYELFNNEAHLTINIIKTLDNVFNMHRISSEKSCNDMPLATFVLLEEISLGPRWETPVLPEFRSCRCH